MLQEASEHTERAALAKAAYELSPAVLEQVRAALKPVKVGDTGLVDLYQNRGNADPGLIASARDAFTADEGKMFRDTWIIVTNDRAVEAKAAEFAIATIKPEELAERIDARSREATWVTLPRCFPGAMGWVGALKVVWGETPFGPVREMSDFAPDAEDRRRAQPCVGGFAGARSL